MAYQNKELFAKLDALFSQCTPSKNQDYDDVMDKTLTDSTPEKEFMGMTYMDHADALNWPDIDYKGLKSPYLVVAGAKDTFIQSSDDFVRKAKQVSPSLIYACLTWIIM